MQIWKDGRMKIFKYSSSHLYNNDNKKICKYKDMQVCVLTGMKAVRHVKVHKIASTQIYGMQV